MIRCSRKMNAESRRLRCRSVSIFRPGQAEMVTQRRSLIVFPEQTTLLQFRDDEVDEVVESFRKMRREEHEPVYRPVPEPLLHNVGNCSRTATSHQIAPRHRDLIVDITQLVTQPPGL